MDMESAGHITGTAEPAERKGISHGQRCADTTPTQQVPEDLQGVVDEEVVAEASSSSTLKVIITNMIMMMIRTMQTFVNSLIISVI